MSQNEEQICSGLRASAQISNIILLLSKLLSRTFAFRKFPVALKQTLFNCILWPKGHPKKHFNYFLFNEVSNLITRCSPPYQTNNFFYHMQDNIFNYGTQKANLNKCRIKSISNAEFKPEQWKYFSKFWLTSGDKTQLRFERTIWKIEYNKIKKLGERLFLNYLSKKVQQVCWPHLFFKNVYKTILSSVFRRWCLVDTSLCWQIFQTMHRVV